MIQLAIGAVLLLATLILAVLQLNGTPWLANEAFLPHGMCFLWQPALVWGHFLADGTITVAYYVIPIQLLAFWKRVRGDLSLVGTPTMLVLWFAIFILGCGTTHLMDDINLWGHFYWLDLWIRIITAGASIGGMITLHRSARAHATKA